MAYCNCDCSRDVSSLLSDVSRLESRMRDAEYSADSIERDLRDDLRRLREALRSEIAEYNAG
jgi:hypothetical protein